MFDDAIKAAKGLQGKLINIPVEPDAKGYFDLKCPADHCGYQFKVHFQDWKQSTSGETCCPMCGTKRVSGTGWLTDEQRQVVQEHAMEHARQALFGGFISDARRFNKMRRPGIVQISLNVTVPPKKEVPPIPSSDAFRIEIQCEHCRFRFSVLGSAYFCPSCGRSSVERVFGQSLGIMRDKMKHARQLRDNPTSTGNPDAAVNIARDLIESCVKDCVTTFQCLCDDLWEQKRPTVTLAKNLFQRLPQGSAQWRTICGEGYEQWLSASQFGRLFMFFQRRHLLAHCDGIVDQDYLTKSGDASYALGQRIVVPATEAEEMVALVEELSTRLRAKLATVP